MRSWKGWLQNSEVFSLCLVRFGPPDYSGLLFHPCLTTVLSYFYLGSTGRGKFKVPPGLTELPLPARVTSTLYQPSPPQHLSDGLTPPPAALWPGTLFLQSLYWKNSGNSMPSIENATIPIKSADWGSPHFHQSHSFYVKSFITEDNHSKNFCFCFYYRPGIRLSPGVSLVGDGNNPL